MEPTAIPLKRTPSTRRLVSAFLMIFLGGLPAIALPLLWFVVSDVISVEVGGAVAVLLVLAVVSWLAWLYALPAPGDFVVDDAGLHFRFARRGVVFVALEELLVCRVDGRDLVLLAAVADGVAERGALGGFVVPGSCFVAKDGAAAVVAAVRERMGRHEHGSGLLSRLDDNAARQQAFASKRPLITWAVSGVCVALFALEVYVGALEPTEAGQRWLVRVGANVPDLVHSGEVWRLVTACLLHGSLLHVGVNLSSLVSTGGLLERWLGKSGYVVVLFVTGVFGHAASAFSGRHSMSVGISGAVFGLLGVLLWSSLSFRKKATGGLRVPVSGWVFLLVANGALSTLPFIDVVAHGAGFVSGVAVAALVAPRPGLPPRLSARVRFAAACVSGAMVVLSLAAALLTGVFAKTQ